MDVSLGNLESLYRPQFLSDRPKSDFGNIRVKKVCTRRARMQDSWELAFTGGAEASFAYLVRGSASLEGSEDPLALTRGDFVMLGPERLFTLRHQEPSELILGKLFVDMPEVIPTLAHLRHSRALKTALKLLVTQAFQRGPQLLRNRLAEIVLLTALRDQVPQRTTDPALDAALRSMHESPEKRWTVADLASTAGMSRSLFAQRFKSLTGEGPLEYLTRHRMHRASQLIRETDRTLSDVATAVGYTSDGAFHKAFRRIIGVSPGEYRRRN